MKHIKLFEELTNVSKIRKWPTYESRPESDYYFIYKLNKNELGKYLNVWFQGRNIDEIKPTNRKRDTETHIFYDEIITVKETDKETSSHLYNRKYNPVSINIMKLNYKKDEFYSMRAGIHSIDDSSYGIWWNNKPIDELKEAREKLMDWMGRNKYGIHGLNGDEFLNICVSLGADEETKDYN